MNVTHVKLVADVKDSNAQEQMLAGPASCSYYVAGPTYTWIVHAMYFADVKDGNAQEQMLAGPASCSPKMQFGCAVQQVFKDSVSLLSGL